MATVRTIAAALLAWDQAALVFQDHSDKYCSAMESGGVNAASSLTYSGGNLTLGNASAGIFNTFQITSNQSCTLSGALAFINQCRGDSIAWNAWSGSGNDQVGIASDDRLHYTSAVSINGVTLNTFAFLSDLSNYVAKNSANTYTGGGLQDFSGNGCSAARLCVAHGNSEWTDRV